MRVVAALIAFATLAAVMTTAASSRSTPSVGVTLKEMTIAVSTQSVAPGKVTFVIQNRGTIEHEFVVLRGVTSLPVKGFKAVEPEANAVDEVEGIEPGKTGRLTVTLTKGKYLLLCNQPGHYQLGMYTTLVVR